MARRSSIRSSRPARTRSERGYALLSALVLAILYFGLMELMLIDTQHALVEASRFRSRVIASTLAENGAELAAADIVNKMSASASDENEQGTMSGTMKRMGAKFVINAEGTSKGILPVRATVNVQGSVNGNHVVIEYTNHSQ